MYVVRTSQRHTRDGALQNHLRARIAACRFLREEAASAEEKEGWLAEEAGLVDALLGIDQTAMQRHDGSPSQRERYAVGLHDGQTIMMASAIPALHMSTRQDGTGLKRQDSGLDRKNIFSPPGKESERYA